MSTHTPNKKHKLQGSPNSCNIKMLPHQSHIMTYLVHWRNSFVSDGSCQHMGTSIWTLAPSCSVVSPLSVSWASVVFWCFTAVYSTIASSQSSFTCISKVMFIIALIGNLHILVIKTTDSKAVLNGLGSYFSPKTSAIHCAAFKIKLLHWLCQ
jgi:hypothetical protein